MVLPRPCWDKAVPPNWMTKQGGDWSERPPRGQWQLWKSYLPLWQRLVTVWMWQQYPKHTATSLYQKGMWLFQSCHWPLGGLSDQSPSCLVIQFGGAAWSRQGLCGTIRLPLLIDCLDCAPRDIQGLWNIFIHITWSVPFHKFIPKVFWKLLGPHGWVFAVKCTTQQRKLTGTADIILK